MFVDTITPQRILDHISRLKCDLEKLNEGDYTGKDAAKFLEFDIGAIESRAKYMIESAYLDALEDRDWNVMRRLFDFNREYRLRAAIALTKYQLENNKCLAGGA